MRTSCSQAWLRTKSSQPVAQSAVFGSSDAVLDMGPVAVPQLQRSDVIVGLVGDEHLMPEPLSGVEQRELRAGVGAFAAGDHPHPLTPVVVVEVGELDQPGAVTTAAVSFDGRGPVLLLDQHEGVAHPEGAEKSYVLVLGPPIVGTVAPWSVCSPTSSVCWWPVRDFSCRPAIDAMPRSSLCGIKCWSCNVRSAVQVVSDGLCKRLGRFLTGEY